MFEIDGCVAVEFEREFVVPIDQLRRLLARLEFDFAAGGDGRCSDVDDEGSCLGFASDGVDAFQHQSAKLGLDGRG